MLLDFKDTGLDVSFFVNKTFLGVAFKSLPIDSYFPSALILFDDCKVRIDNQVNVPEYQINFLFQEILLKLFIN